MNPKKISDNDWDITTNEREPHFMVEDDVICDNDIKKIIDKKLNSPQDTLCVNCGLSKGNHFGRSYNLCRRFIPQNQDEICRCGHYSNNHSYNPKKVLDMNLYCDKCDCKNFIIQNKCEVNEDEVIENNLKMCNGWYEEGLHDMKIIILKWIKELKWHRTYNTTFKVLNELKTRIERENATQNKNKHIYKCEDCGQKLYFYENKARWCLPCYVATLIKKGCGKVFRCNYKDNFPDEIIRCGEETSAGVELCIKCKEELQDETEGEDER